MCIHEIWTYAECGCKVDHHIPCSDSPSHQQTRQRSPLRRQPNYSLLRSQVNSSPVHFPPSPSPTDTEDEAQLEDYYRQATRPRQCSVYHQVHKTFLEPICEDCLLAEVGREGRHGNQVPSLETHHREGLIFDSDVKIEIDGLASTAPRYSPHSDLAYSPARANCRSHIDMMIEDTPILSPSTPWDMPPRAPTATSADLADDESPKLRGHPRSRTKQLRRHAMDVSREDVRLRVSSRWPSDVRRSMQIFKDELQGRSKSPQKMCDDAAPTPPSIQKSNKQPPPTKSFTQRFSQVHEEGRTWMKGVVGDLQRSLSKRGGLRRGLKSARASQDDVAAGDGRFNINGTKSGKKSAICTLRAVVDNPELQVKGSKTGKPGDVLELLEDDQGHDGPKPTKMTTATASAEMFDGVGSNQQPTIADTTDTASTRPTSDSSWQAHLAQDLTNRKRPNKHRQRVPKPRPSSPSPGSPHIPRIQPSAKSPPPFQSRDRATSSSSASSPPATLPATIVQQDLQDVPPNIQPFITSGSFPRVDFCPLSAMPTACFTPALSSTSNPFSQASYEYDSPSESQRRLLSGSTISSGASTPALVLSGSRARSTSMPLSFAERARHQRLASIVSESEFDDPARQGKGELAYRLDIQVGGQDTNKGEETHANEEKPKPGEPKPPPPPPPPPPSPSPKDTRNQFPVTPSATEKPLPPSPTSPHTPRASTPASAQDTPHSTFKFPSHAIATPLQPQRTPRANPGPQSSSFHSRPSPSSSPPALHHFPPALPAHSENITATETNNPVESSTTTTTTERCIWLRRTCPGTRRCSSAPPCGTPLSTASTPVACICDTGTQRESVCTSTSPRVIYVVAEQGLCEGCIVREADGGSNV